MPKVSKAPGDVRETIDDLISERYPLLATARIGCLLSDDVKEFGQHVAAKVKVNNEADRLDGKPDATITLERAGWNVLELLPEASRRSQRRAILETMLYSLDVQTYPNGEVMTDDEGRPVMEKRPVDWLVCGYAAMAQRYGADSLEVIQAARLREEYGDLLFGFMGRPGESDLVRDTFAALLSVGHTEAMARRAIDAVLADGTACSTVAEMIDAIYLKQRVASGEVVGEILDEVAAQVNAGAMGPDVTATATRRSRRKPEPAGARA